MKSKTQWIPFILLGFIVVICVLAPVLPISDPLTMDMLQRFAPPSMAEPLGNDEYGRSVLSRIVWGTQISLIVALCSAGIACIIGTTLGILAAYLRGAVDMVIMRLMDVLLCLPALLLAMLFVTLYGGGASALIPIMALVFVPSFTRVAYSGVLTVRSQEYVEAAQAIGASRTRVMFRTILPNISAPMLVQLSLAAAAAVTLESGLSFLGLGIVPPDASLGMMIGTARSTMAYAPLLLVWPCLALTILVLVLNAVCDALRDLLDPRPAGGADATE